MNGGKIKSFLATLLAALSLSIVIGTARDLSAAYVLTDQELDDLLAPIALYPDPLLAQMLPASTYPSDVVDAAGWLRSGGDPSFVDEQNWDENVGAIAHYPQVLYMMADNIDWTASVGDAFLNQPEDVTNSIQRLRWQAQTLGNLVSNDQQAVTTEGGDIQIIPAQPQYIYVPQYDPSIVYVQARIPVLPPYVTFPLVFTIGSWLDLDFDWGHHHVFYHGWNRPGWVNHARPYVHITNVYVQRSRPYINQTWRHNPSHGDPDRYWTSRPGGAPSGSYPHGSEVRGRSSTPTGPAAGPFVPNANTRQFSDRGKESLGTAVPRPTPQAPAAVPRPAPQAPAAVPRPAPQAPAAVPHPAPQAPAVFGGYRGLNEVKTQSMRGQASRQSNVGGSTAPASVNKVGAPSSRGEPGSGGHR